MKEKIASSIVFLCGCALVAIRNIVPTPLLELIFHVRSQTVDNTLNVKSFLFGWRHLLLFFGCALMISALFCFIFTKTAKNSLKPLTTAISLVISGMCSGGFYCFLVLALLENHSKHPITYPVGVSLLLISFFSLPALLCAYFAIRQKHWSIKGIIIDVLTCVTFMPSIFFACMMLHDILD